MGRAEAEDLLRQLAPQVLGALVRRYGHFDTAEDAVQEALLAAATQWPAEGLPGNPRGWLITVASRRLTDLLRSEQSRRAREEAAARRIPPGEWLAKPSSVAFSWRFARTWSSTPMFFGYARVRYSFQYFSRTALRFAYDMNGT